jgi:hypothetical protein
MPRNFDDADDDYGDRRPSARSGMSPVLIIVLVVGGVLVVGAVLCGGFLLFSARAVRDAAEEQAAVQADAAARAAKAGTAKAGTKRVWTRDEFRKLVMGKTPDEVVAAVGQPDGTDEDGGRPVWTYRGRTKDPGTGKTDAAVSVRFARGSVIEVGY